MFDIGDEVVCIGTPEAGDYEKAADYYKEEPCHLQVGVVYTIVDMKPFPMSLRHNIGLRMAETGIWYWSHHLFRKVKKIEEPKRMETKVPELV